MMNKLGNREEQELKLKEANEVALRILHKRKCDKCYNRGYSGWNQELGQYIPCECVLKAAEKVRLEKRKHPTKEQVPEQVN